MDIKRVLASAPRKHDLGEERYMLTAWGEALDPAAVRQEHPRPQFARERFTMLNGWWDFCIVPVGACPTVRVPDERDGRILVPFSPESLLSGVRRALAPDELLWYVRRVPRPRLRPGERCLLHFEAVDFACACCVNGRVVGTHEGGYLPFVFDITEAITLDEERAAALDAGVRSEIVVAVAVRDPSDAGTQLRGKQKRERGGIWYTAQSGIWQPVWMEVVPARRIEGLALRPDASAGRLIVDVDVRGDEGLLRLYVTDGNGAPVASASVPVEEGAMAAWPPAGENGDPLRRVRVSVDVPDPRLWSPEHPHLYDLTLRFGTDVVHSYTAFRTVEVRADAHGTSRFFLNGEPLLLRGVLDQGYWSDGLMTAPSDEAMVFDIQSMKDAGFNMLRKHLKVEADRWYYHCDRLGMLVWQDISAYAVARQLGQLRRSRAVSPAETGRWRRALPRPVATLLPGHGGSPAQPPVGCLLGAVQRGLGPVQRRAGGRGGAPGRPDASGGCGQRLVRPALRRLSLGAQLLPHVEGVSR